MNTSPSAKLICLIASLSLGFLLLARAVTPPPDGGYPGANTAEGQDALFSLTGGTGNTAVGFEALRSITNSNQNTAVGYHALYSNAASNSFANTAIGWSALENNTLGQDNTANGFAALRNNTTGNYNVAIGSDVLEIANITGSQNTGVGTGALAFNSGDSNTALGNNSLPNNTTGNSNIAVGSSAGSALTTGSNNIDIGNVGAAAESTTIRIGVQGTQTATFVAGIRGVPITGAQQVGISATGQLGVRPSSARFKEAIKPIDKTSEAIFKLRPVSFRYKKELDPKGVRQFGLVAEEVAMVDRDLVMPDEHGKAFSVRYDEVNAMLLNEFLKAHDQIEELEAISSELRSTVAKQTGTITELKSTVAQEEAAIARQQQAMEAFTARLTGSERNSGR